LRRVKERASTDGLSVVVIPEQGIAEARRVLAAERFQVEAHESEGLEWSPIPAETVVAGLREISRRQKRARFWLLMLLPAGLLGVASGSQFLFSLIPIVWMPGFLIAYFRALNADCPRCGLPFGRGPNARSFRSLGRLFSDTCETCGIPLSSDDGSTG